MRLDSVRQRRVGISERILVVTMTIVVDQLFLWVPCAVGDEPQDLQRASIQSYIRRGNELRSQDRLPEARETYKKAMDEASRHLRGNEQPFVIASILLLGIDFNISSKPVDEKIAAKMLAVASRLKPDDVWRAHATNAVAMTVWKPMQTASPDNVRNTKQIKENELKLTASIKHF